MHLERTYNRPLDNMKYVHCTIGLTMRVCMYHSTIHSIDFMMRVRIVGIMMRVCMKRFMMKTERCYMNRDTRTKTAFESRDGGLQE
jgi:hypothetical protein